MTDEHDPDRDWRPPDQLTDDELVARVKHRNKATEIPPCRVCGGPLEVQAAGGGHPTVYACSTQEDDPDRPGRLRYKEGRKVADDHYRASRFEDPRHTDSSSYELARRFEVLRREVEALKSERPVIHESRREYKQGDIRTILAADARDGVAVDLTSPDITRVTMFVFQMGKVAEERRPSFYTDGTDGLLVLVLDRVGTFSVIVEVVQGGERWHTECESFEVTP